MSEAVTKTAREREKEASRERKFFTSIAALQSLNNKHLDEIFCIPFVTGKKSEREQSDEGEEDEKN